MRRAVSTIALLLLVTVPLFAHVGVSPRESKLGATETYTFNVPSEGGRTTVAVVLDVPEGVTVNSVTAPEGAKHEEKKSGDRVTEIAWTIEIKAGMAAKLSFVAKNPDTGDSIVWKVHQKYSDASVSDWVGPAGSRAPAPVTKLLPASPGTRP